jgi:hypothetical protein
MLAQWLHLIMLLKGGGALAQRTDQERTFQSGWLFLLRQGMPLSGIMAAGVASTRWPTTSSAPLRRRPPRQDIAAARISFIDAPFWLIEGA